MKNLKLIIITVLIGSYSCQGQHNILSESEFNAVKFGDASLIDIFQSLGDVDQMNTLFVNYPLSNQANNSHPMHPGRDFFNLKISIGFSNESGNQYDLSDIDILSSSISVNVKGIEIRLGDHINIFGNNIEIIEHPDEKIVNFTDEGTGTSSLAFYILPSTNRIIKITFNVY